MWNIYQNRGPGMVPNWSFDWRTYSLMHKGQPIDQISSAPGDSSGFQQKMDPLTVGLSVGVPLLTSVVNSLFTGSSNRQNASLYRDYMQMQRSLQTNAQNYNTMMWRMTNQWNSPANQMSLLRAAGLNPNLMYGGAFQGNASAQQSPSQGMSAPGNVYNPMSVSLGNPSDTLLNERLVSSNEQLSNSQSSLNEAEADLKKKELGTYDEKFEKWKTRWSAELDNLNQNTNLLKSNLDKLDNELRLIQAQTGLTIQESYNRFFENVIYGNALDDIIHSYAVRNNLDESLIKANLGYAAFMNANAHNVRLNNKITEDCMDWIEKGLVARNASDVIEWNVSKFSMWDRAKAPHISNELYTKYGEYLNTKNDWLPIQAIGSSLGSISNFFVPYLAKGKLLDKRYSNHNQYQSNPFK